MNDSFVSTELGHDTRTAPLEGFKDGNTRFMCLPCFISISGKTDFPSVLVKEMKRIF